LDLGDYSCVVELVQKSLRVEVDKQIDVAVRALGAARCRTEEREVFDAKLLEPRRGRAKNLENIGTFLRVGEGRLRGWNAEDGTALKQGDAGRLKRRSDGGKIGRNGFALAALKVSDGEPRDVGLPGQFSLASGQPRSSRHLSGGPRYFVVVLGVDAIVRYSRIANIED
jgi:hypothetical protein